MTMHNKELTKEHNNILLQFTSDLEALMAKHNASLEIEEGAFNVIFWPVRKNGATIRKMFETTIGCYISADETINKFK